MAKRILITGGAGFVGSHIADALLAKGHEVVVFDNLTPQVHGPGLPGYLSPEVEFIEGDMRDLEAVRRAIQGVDVIFHMAAAVGVGQSMYEISNYIAANTLGTAHLLQALLDTKIRINKLIVASSMSIYGEGKYLCVNCGEMAPRPRTNQQLKQKSWETRCPQCGVDLTPLPTDETKPLQYTSIYALSKKDQEQMCLLFGKVYELPVVALRFFNIYGTRQALSNPYTGVVAIFASRLLNDRPPLIFEDGKQMRDFVSVDDVVQANLLAMDRSEANGEAINVGSGVPISIREIATALEATLGKKIGSEISGRYRAGDIRHCFADISKAKRLLGYEPRVTFQNGMEELVQWLRSQQAEDKAAEMVANLNSFGLTA
jgi:dTDP-L-rhamnose 4-epimerase